MNSVYPGLVTDTLMEGKSWVYGHNWYSSMTAFSGAFTLIHAATSPTLDGIR